MSSKEEGLVTWMNPDDSVDSVYEFRYMYISLIT